MRILYCTHFLLSFTFLYDKNIEIDRLKFAKGKPQATAENFFEDRNKILVACAIKLLPPKQLGAFSRI